MNLNDTQQTMKAASAGLGSLFHPESIAFLGASERPSAPASRGLRNCLRLGFKGKLYPINPRHKELFGVKAYASLSELPEAPELVMIGLSAEKTLDAVEECERVGVKAVIICSAGWEEQGEEGQARARQLAAFIERSKLRILGPNCLGVGTAEMGISLGYNSSFESISLGRSGQIALVTQSGAMMGGLVLNGEDVGANVSHYAHIGNGMDIGMEEITDYLLDVPGVKAIALMIEGLRDPARFVEVARRAQSIGKPLVVFKAGRSEEGREAVMSHTGALAGSDEVFTTVCEETSIIRVEESEDLLTTAAGLAQWKDKVPVGSKGLAVFTLSGGAASIIADECGALGVPLATLTPETQARLAPLLPSYVKVGNPFDVGGAVFSDPELPRETLAIVMADANVDSILWVGVGAPRDDRSNLWLNQAIDVMSGHEKAGILVSISGYVQEEGFDRAREMNVPIARSIRSAVTLISHARRTNAAVCPQGSIDGVNIPDLPQGQSIIDEVSSKALLKQLGVAVPDSRVVESAAEVGAKADELGYPVVLKGLVRDTLHKSELGLVALNLDTPESVQEAAEEMIRRNPTAPFTGFLVEKMAPRGIEVVLGIKRDEAFGQMFMFGLGGVFVELFKDVSFGMCPLSPERAREMIAATKAATWLRGFRGQPPADVDALVDTMVRVSRLAAKHADTIEEMDINPVLVLPEGEGVIALDAVIVRKAT